MSFKKIISFFLCVIIVFLLSACSSQQNEKTYVAVIVKSINSDFFSNMKNGVQSAAIEYNVKITFEGPQNEEDYAAQEQMINKAVKNKADVILLSAIDYEKLDSAVDNAVKNGVKVITVDSGIKSSLVSGFIGTDNYNAGISAGNAALSGFSKDEKIVVGIVNYTEATDNGKRREEGFKKVLSENENAGVAACVVTESNTQSAKSAAVSMIKENPQINVIVGFNEWMTLGIGEAIKELKAGDRIKAIGFDSNVNSVEMLETGEMDALIVQNPFAMGYLGVKNADLLVKGEKFPDENIYTAVAVVTEENMFDEDIQKMLFRFS